MHLQDSDFAIYELISDWSDFLSLEMVAAKT